MITILLNPFCMISKKNQFVISFYQVYFLEISLPPANGVENAMLEKVSVPPFICEYIACIYFIIIIFNEITTTYSYFLFY